MLNNEEECYHVVFNLEEYKGYKDLYIDISNKLDAKNNYSCNFDYEDFGCNLDILWEFLSEFVLALKFDVIFVGLSDEIASNRSKLAKYEYSSIIIEFLELMADYPENRVRFMTEEEYNEKFAEGSLWE